MLSSDDRLGFGSPSGGSLHGFFGVQPTSFPIGEQLYYMNGSWLRSPHRPLSATEDADQSPRMPYVSEAWTFGHGTEAAGVADAMIEADISSPLMVVNRSLLFMKQDILGAQAHILHPHAFVPFAYRIRPQVVVLDC